MIRHTTPLKEADTTGHNRTLWDRSKLDGRWIALVCLLDAHCLRRCSVSGPSPPGNGFFGEFLNGGGASFSAGPLPVEGFISFTGLRSFDVIGFGRSFFEAPRQ